MLLPAANHSPVSSPFSSLSLHIHLPDISTICPLQSNAAVKGYLTGSCRANLFDKPIDKRVSVVAVESLLVSK